MHPWSSSRRAKLETRLLPADEEDPASSRCDPPPRRARASAVTTAAPNTATTTGARRARATAANATPSARASSVSERPLPNVSTTTQRGEQRRGEQLDDAPSRRRAASRPPSSSGPASFSAAVASASETISHPDRAHARVLDTSVAAGGGGQDGQPGRRERGQDERDPRAAAGRDQLATPARLLEEQRHEEGREQRVQPERPRIAQRMTGQHSDDRAEHPGRVLRAP